MTIDKLFEIVSSIEDTETKFKICRRLYPIYDMDKLVQVYNNDLKYLYNHSSSFSFGDNYFYEDDNNTIHSFDDMEDVVDNLFWGNVITTDIAERININNCKTKYDIFYKLGIDI